jgi:hypothetical protein
MLGAPVFGNEPDRHGSNRFSNFTKGPADVPDHATGAIARGCNRVRSKLMGSRLCGRSAGLRSGEFLCLPPSRRIGVRRSAPASLDRIRSKTRS